MAQNTDPQQSVEQLTRLETKIHRAVELLQATRAEKEMLARENTHFRKQLGDQQRSVRPLQEQVARLEKERAAIQTRLQKLLQQVDLLLEAGLDAG